MTSIRSLLENTTRGLVVRRKLGTRFGRAAMYVTPSAGLRYLFKRMDEVDPTLVHLASEFVRPGDTVWDVGANVGLFSVTAAHAAGRSGQVLAVEPDARLVQLLRRTAAAQDPRHAPMTIVPAAVANSVAARTFVLAPRSNSTNHLAGYGLSETGGAGQKVTVLAVTLDWLSTQFAPPDVIKIDVEGAELEVLSGASEVLGRHKPRLIVEVDRPHKFEVWKVLNGYGYSMFNGELGADRSRQSEIAPWMTVAIPG